ncbi:hypothetical protein BofuT4_uP077780.1 [Botrytis cinerea T4]|uniref:Uncharacterized protein n=1 Tax=Botryotinia fuckeliana (strain T4) TaxID=999810 RepID=G2YLI7_BOTF4|nr:hypothetical protein BofuT4_uP077780.1 [Botrytis cinerea T4]
MVSIMCTPPASALSMFAFPVSFSLKYWYGYHFITSIHKMDEV